MKLIFSSILLAVTLIFNNFHDNYHSFSNGHFEPPPPTTLDSLQGSWVNQNDTTNQMKVTGRSLTQINIDTSTHQTSNAYFTIYFSDTTVNRYLDQDSTTISINKTSLTGNYLVEVSTLDSSVWCYKINGFYKDTSGLTFSMSDIWAHHVPGLFKKR